MMKGNGSRIKYKATIDGEEKIIIYYHNYIFGNAYSVTGSRELHRVFPKCDGPIIEIERTKDLENTLLYDDNGQYIR